MDGERDAYTVLQVDPRAEADVVRAAYRALARRYHPDGAAPDAQRMSEINQAFDQVRTPERRQQYDAARRRVPVGPGRPRASTTATTTATYDPWAAGPSEAAGPRPDPEVIDFGRYAGWRIADLARHDPDYLRWLSRHSTGIRFVDAIRRHLPGEAVGRRGSWVGS